MANDTKNKSKPTSIAVSTKTKDALNSIKHPGQSYDGLLQELIKLWKSGHKKRT